VKRRRLGWPLLLVLGLGCIGYGAWIPAKAALAQHLLERAWRRVQAGAVEPVERVEPIEPTETIDVRPWSWADTQPVARLEAPALDARWIVLAAASGRTLAFGPAHLSGTASPGAPGNSVLFGHRDTHFTAIGRLRAGHVLHVETPTGERVTYRVAFAEVVDERDTWPLEPSGDRRELTLITCFPFDAIVPGGPLRYVVRAVADEASRAPMLAARRPSSAPLARSASSTLAPSGP